MTVVWKNLLLVLAIPVVILILGLWFFQSLAERLAAMLTLFLDTLLGLR